VWCSCRIIVAADEMDDVMAEGEAAENPCRARFLVLVSHYVSDLSGDLGMLHVDLAINEQRSSPDRFRGSTRRARAIRNTTSDVSGGISPAADSFAASSERFAGAVAAAFAMVGQEPPQRAASSTTLDGCPDWLMCSPDRV